MIAEVYVNILRIHDRALCMPWFLIYENLKQSSVKLCLDVKKVHNNDFSKNL